MADRTCECGCGRSLVGRPAKTRFFEAACRRKSFTLRQSGDLPAASVETPPGTGVMSVAVRAALVEAGRAESYLGAFALALAARVDGCTGVTGVAPVVHELRETMTAALAGASKAGRLREMRQSHARKG